MRSPHMKLSLIAAIFALVVLPAHAQITPDTKSVHSTPFSAPNTAGGQSYSDYAGNPLSTSVNATQDTIRFTCPVLKDNQLRAWVHVSQAGGTTPLLTEVYVGDALHATSHYSGSLAVAGEPSFIPTKGDSFNLSDIRTRKTFGGFRTGIPAYPNPDYSPILSSISVVDWPNGTNVVENIAIVITKPYGMPAFRFRVQFGCQGIYLPAGAFASVIKPLSVTNINQTLGN